MENQISYFVNSNGELVIFVGNLTVATIKDCDKMNEKQCETMVETVLSEQGYRFNSNWQITGRTLPKGVSIIIDTNKGKLRAGRSYSVKVSGINFDTETATIEYEDRPELWAKKRAELDKEVANYRRSLTITNIKLKSDYDLSNESDRNDFREILETDIVEAFGCAIHDDFNIDEIKIEKKHEKALER